MDKIIEHMAVNHGEVKKEEWVEPSNLAVNRCFICNKIFYSMQKNMELIRTRTNCQNIATTDKM